MLLSLSLSLHLMLVQIKKNIPNAITCGNLLCGCLAIVFIFNNDLLAASGLVVLAGVLDFLDGMVARLLKVHSEIGKQLDSLADMVTFGVVPGLMMFKLIRYALYISSDDTMADPFTLLLTQPKEHLPSYVAFCITIFSALRLAKFNIDTRQSDSFIGVPTPAVTLLVASFPYILANHNALFLSSSPIYPPLSGLSPTLSLQEAVKNGPWFVQLLSTPGFLVGLSFLLSYLLIAELPLIALKFKHFGWKGNEIRYIFIVVSAILLILLKFAGVPIVFFLYVGMSVINNQLSKKSSEGPHPGPLP